MNVLVVDDDPDLRGYVERSLTRGFGPTVRVHHAGDGEDALEAVDGGRFDAVVTDVLLPRMDGLTLCAALRDAALPVLVVSGELEAMERARRAVLGDPRAAFLAKPFNGASLCAALSRLLEG